MQKVNVKRLSHSIELDFETLMGKGSMQLAVLLVKVVVILKKTLTKCFEQVS